MNISFKKMFKKEKKVKIADLENMTASQIGTYLNQNQAAASDAALDGMNLFRDAATKLLNVEIDKKQGNLFEYIEAAKFNIDAASKGAHHVKAVVTAADGNPHAAADILIKKGNKIVEEVQAKSSNSVASATYMISDEKYRGMQKLVNSDKADAVRELATKRANMGTYKQEDYIDTSKHVTGELKHGSIRSGGTSYDEAVSSAKNPNQFANQLEFNQFKQEVLSNATQSTITGGVIGGAISVVKNGFLILNDDVDANQAAKNIATDTIKSGTKAGATGALGSAIRIGAKKTDLIALGKGNAATSLAAGVIECGVTVYKFAKGEISGEQAIEKMGQTSFSTCSSIFTGLAAGVVFGPGMIATMGSLAGYMLATHVYQTCITILKNAKLAEEEAHRVVALLKESINQMKEQRLLFEKHVEEQLELRRSYFNSCFTAIRSGLESSNPADVVEGLNDFALAFNQKLKLSSFEEFDQYMKKNDTLYL